MAKQNLYFKGPWPVADAALKALCSGGEKGPQKYHASVSPDGTEFLAHGDFDSSVKSAPPPGCVWMTYEDALAQRVAWDKDVKA